MSWVDIALLCVLVLSILVGFVRGLIFELLSLLGWVAAYFTAYWVAPAVAPHIPFGAVGSSLKEGIAFGGVFIAALLVWGLLAGMMRTLVRASPLSGLDRLMGGGFGAVRGLLLMFVLVVVAALTPVKSSDAWRGSTGAMWLNALMQDLKPALPPEVSRHLPA